MRIYELCFVDSILHRRNGRFRIGVVIGCRTLLRLASAIREYRNGVMFSKLSVKYANIESKQACCGAGPAQYHTELNKIIDISVEKILKNIESILSV